MSSMDDNNRIADLERRLLAMHEYNKRMTTVTRCHDEILKVLCSQLGIRWEVVELPVDSIQ